MILVCATHSLINALALLWHMLSRPIVSNLTGYGDFEPFSVNTGIKRLRTPNVAAFAKQGMRFTHAYAAREHQCVVSMLIFAFLMQLKSIRER